MVNRVCLLVRRNKRMRVWRMCGRKRKFVTNSAKPHTIFVSNTYFEVTEDWRYIQEQDSHSVYFRISTKTLPRKEPDTGPTTTLKMDEIPKTCRQKRPSSTGLRLLWTEGHKPSPSGHLHTLTERLHFNTFKKRHTTVLTVVSKVWWYRRKFTKDGIWPSNKTLY